VNRFVKKIIEMLLKKTEHLNSALDSSKDANDPMQKRMKALLEKRELMKAAVNDASKPKKQVEQTAPMSKTIADSLAAKKSALTPPKNASSAKKNNRPKRRGR
jgi:hypothetical protein